MASACGRRSAAAASRSRRAAAESNENDDLAPAPSSSTSSFAAAAPFSLPPRSPLAAIADPGRNPRSAPATPKLAASTPVGARACAGRDRSSSIWVARRVFDPRDLEAVEVPHFELEEDPAFWKDRNVQVLIRIRPVSAAESAVHGHKRCLMQESSKTLSWTGHPETMFTFDHVACETISQEKLFKVVGLPMVENCMSGYNGCLFAYGQTGSGKTYTMMGELSKLDNDLTEDSGLTPRIFEYLFARIKEEEESRREEKLKYSCKCSFLEIYNEQITDLLEPSSTNLQIREDIKKGVYVENLMECHVSSVKDAMMLLLQGVTNRKMAATNMNSESSRSHSVFTCVIESRWERDSMTHFRFGRLNLVDLAGSERQKSSGAEGDRLKEAANINRSLSTLGLVIMTLVDVANGKTRHVPYRDSRLTFLLQDSLGGNSKTTIVANVSPSICSSSETLSTLKFAQRAKLIQNNAKVNEDASGDVMALQRQIEKLKDELSCLKKQQNLPGTSCYPSASLLLPYSGSANEVNSLCGGDDESWCDPNILMQKVSHLEAVLVGSLRRERAAEAEVRKMEAEIKHLNRLVHLKEADVQRLQTMLKIRDEKLRRLDLLADDLVSSDSYLMDENVALSQEIQLLQQQINENPMLTHFALENMRLIEQLRMLQKYHKQGEREMLLTEISLLRNHFLHILERKYATPFENIEAQGDEIIKELDNCRKELDACLENNVLLAREVNKLRCELRQYKNSSTTEAQMVAFEAEDLIPEINPLQHDQVGRNFSHFASNDAQNQFMGTGIATSSTESLQFRLPSETDSEDQEAPCHLHLFNPETGDVKDPTKESVFSGVLSDFYSMALGASHNVLGEGIVLSEEMKDKNTSEFVQQDEISQVQEKAENTNLSLHNKASFCQKETERGSLLKPLARDELLHLKSINQELKEKLVIMAEENNKLANIIVVKDVEITSLSEDWEAAIVDLTSFLIDGCRSLDDAYQNIDNMVNSFPQSNNSIGEKVEKAMKLSIEKEKMIIKLQIELQEAQRLGSEVNEKLHILRGATLAITEAQQVEIDGSSKETLLLLELLCQKDSKIQELQNNVKQKDDTLAAAEENSSGALPLLHNLGNVYAEEPLDENQANPKYQPKLKSVLQFVEDKSNQVLSLFSNFEEAQETMEEAERMLSALLKANGEVKLERDKCKEAVEMLLAEKTYLIDELHELEESNYYTVEKSEKIHQQTNECVAEMTKLATLIKGSFQDIHMVTTAELSAIFSEMITFALELRKWMSESKSNLVNIVPVIGETDNSSVEQVHHLNANASACELQEVELLCSRQRGSSNTEFHDGTQAIEDISSEPLVTITNMAEGRKEMSSVHVVTDYVSLRREVARKSDIVEGLSFDLKLLQESTSHAKDMKVEADKILTALGKAHRELEMKTSAMENMMEKQKALEGELAENGAALIILRAELEQAQSLSSVLLKENNDLRVLLEEETVKTDGTRNLLEDKVKVVEGLESQILLLNSSEEGCLLLRIKELNNEAKIIRSDKENLQSEVLKLNDKLEMAVALAEENEATAIEARQAAEISKIYAEEKEEEVKILERSVEELEAITGVLEEEVCNLKEEVRGYQLYKQSGTEFQDVVDGMLPVDNTANCDGTENLCSRKCQLQKKLQTEVVALQEARRKIEGLNTEARRKDEEIRQYKDHIAELVMHSEAQSLLFQDKYQELQQVITKHKFGPPESNSEVANAKTEKPSVRTRGSSSPFRCVSSIIQQMNSEKDQELSVARQRIEELEALVTNKQKEICLLMSRLAAVDSMTHDVIRELLGVRLDMTNYSNLLDQEELQKLFIASQQQIEESKAKDMELEMLKKQFGRFIRERDSMFDDMNQRKADLLESQLLVEQLEQREQMLEAQNEMLQMEKANLQQKIMEMDETIELLIRSNDEITETAHRMSDNQQHVSSEFSRRLAQSDILLSHARHEHSRNHTNKSTRVHRDSHQ